MPVTAKEVARHMGISEATVSMALNGKSGVSKKRREEILAVARTLGYDFTRLNNKFSGGSISMLLYTKYRTILDSSEFFADIERPVEEFCKEKSMKYELKYISRLDELIRTLKVMANDPTAGVILVATEMTELEVSEVSRIEHLHIVVLDCVYSSISMNYVCTNNRQGAYMATEFLLKQFHTQPGYIKSSYSIANFRERSDGFFSAIQAMGLSPSQSIVHQLSPFFDGAYEEMKQLLEAKTPLARCYFADNDQMALGAIKAFKEYGYKIPRDVAIIGFDDTEQGQKSSPQLSSVSVPTRKIGVTAATRLYMEIEHSDDMMSGITSLVNTSLAMRGSTDIF